jgi:hypothetical protein
MGPRLVVAAPPPSAARDTGTTGMPQRAWRQTTAPLPLQPEASEDRRFANCSWSFCLPFWEQGGAPGRKNSGQHRSIPHRHTALKVLTLTPVDPLSFFLLHFRL